MTEPIRNNECCSVFLYTSFLEKEQKDMRYCTTAEKFKRDMYRMIKAGYHPVSLKDFYSFKHKTDQPYFSYFSVVMIGGYEDNYTIAFPILKEMNVPASIFVCTDLVQCSLKSKRNAAASFTNGVFLHNTLRLSTILQTE